MFLPRPKPLQVASYQKLNFDDLPRQLVIFSQDHSLLVPLSQVVNNDQTGCRIWSRLHTVGEDCE